ncbi:MAG TPA: hypothetical protein VD905_18370 [Flavobacteriales bacterium]|nr:hypothetical protein [Flavobacteriales bacterium]
MEIRILFICYSFIITVFTIVHLFFLSITIGDYNNAVEKYYSYQYLIKYNDADWQKFVSRETVLNDQVSINGVSKKLFSGVDYNGEYFSDENQYSKFPIERIEENSKKPITEVIRPIHENTAPVYWKCLLFSVSIITNTSDFGLQPASWDAIAIVIAGKLIYIIYLIIVVGLLFTGFWKKKPETLPTSRRRRPLNKANKN